MRASKNCLDVMRLILHDVKTSHGVATDRSPGRQPWDLIDNTTFRFSWHNSPPLAANCARKNESRVVLSQPGAHAPGYAMPLLRSWISRRVNLSMRAKRLLFLKVCNFKKRERGIVEILH